MPWWFWCIGGLALMIAELLTPLGFYLFFLGFSALVVGGISATGLLQTIEAQGLLFAVVALASSVLFARAFQRKLRVPKMKEDTVGQVVKVLAHVPAGELGSGELWGSPWRIQNIDSRDLPADSKAVVVGIEEEEFDDADAASSGLVRS
jgi:membrane protein implicated in regulation of membrane protease activity